MMDNKRQYPRFSFSEPVAYQKGARFTLEGCVAADISQTGLKLCVNEFIPLHTILELQIQLPGRTGLVPLKAKVVWVREMTRREDSWEIGLQLISSEDFSAAIQEYVGLLGRESLS